jgi:hypothetical protein
MAPALYLLLNLIFCGFVHAWSGDVLPNLHQKIPGKEHASHIRAAPFRLPQPQPRLPTMPQLPRVPRPQSIPVADPHIPATPAGGRSQGQGPVGTYPNLPQMTKPSTIPPPPINPSLPKWFRQYAVSEKGPWSIDRVREFAVKLGDMKQLFDKVVGRYEPASDGAKITQYILDNCRPQLSKDFIKNCPSSNTAGFAPFSWPQWDIVSNALDQQCGNMGYTWTNQGPIIVGVEECAGLIESSFWWWNIWAHEQVELQEKAVSSGFESTLQTGGYGVDYVPTTTSSGSAWTISSSESSSKWSSISILTSASTSTSTPTSASSTTQTPTRTSTSISANIQTPPQTSTLTSSNGVGSKYNAYKTVKTIFFIVGVIYLAV